MKAFVIDIARCNGCFNCQIVCKDEHCEADWSPIAKPQPMTGQFWMKVSEKVRGQAPMVHVAYTPRLCAHCSDAPCAKVAPELFERREDGLLILKPEPVEAALAQQIADACPIGAIYVNEELGIAQKCTGCAHLLDNGWTVPRCVDACCTDALLFGEEDELAELIADAVPYPGLEDAGVHVYYRNLPKRFVGMSIIDFEGDEVVTGARVTLEDAAGSVVDEQLTDEFGDYFKDGLEAGIYTLTVEKEGFAPLSLEADLTAEDKSLGDIGFEWLGGERPALDRSYTPSFTGVIKTVKKEEEEKTSGAGMVDQVGGEGAIAAATAAALAGADAQFAGDAPAAAPTKNK